jgi:hypothetical protein
MKNTIVPISALDTKPAEILPKKLGWSLFKTRDTSLGEIWDGPCITFFWSSEKSAPSKARRFLKKDMKNWWYGGFCLIDEENGQIINFTYMPKQLITRSHS